MATKPGGLADDGDYKQELELHRWNSILHSKLPSQVVCVGSREPCQTQNKSGYQKFHTTDNQFPSSNWKINPNKTYLSSYTEIQVQ